ncbi:unnamed protein product [Cercospora beticola]|nr:unnamed protein product [Cercospora beticola]
MAAAARVFAIGELVEMILLELPTKDLLLSQRINRACKTAVDSSNRIQKALFFIPGVCRDANVEHITPDVKPSPESTSDSASDSDSDSSSDSDSDSGSDSDSDWTIDGEDFPRSRSYHDAIVGKLSAKLARKMSVGQDVAAVRQSGVALNPLLVSKTVLCATRGFYVTIYPHTFNMPEIASCSKMLITQPPIYFPSTQLHWMYSIDGGVKFHSCCRPYSLPQSVEGTTIRKLAKVIVDATGEMSRRIERDRNHSPLSLSSLFCVSLKNHCTAL